jgi:antirestriction protein ArdC
MEELVAELGSTFLSADLELTPEVREDHERRVECQRHRHGDEFQR